MEHISVEYVEVKEKVKWEDFKMGMKFDGKLAKKTVRGGCLLVPTTFEIKEYSTYEL